jgi:LemA protein
MVVTEQYPDLKANQNFLGLQEELTSTENKIGFARQAYNDAVMTYNTKIETFPSNLVAGNFGFKPEPFFQVQDEKERQAPQVKF